MKKLLFALTLCFVGFAGYSQTYVQGYYKANGTYVAPYYPSNTNPTKHDNYRTFGNINIYNSNTRYKVKDYTPAAYNYGAVKTILRGPKSGQYYINSNGNKTYVPNRW